MKKPERPPIEGTFAAGQRKTTAILQDKKVLIELGKIEREYLYWDKFKYKVKHLKADPETIWRLVKLQRERNMSRLNLSDSTDFHFKYNISGMTLKRLHEFDMNMGGVLEGGSIIPHDDRERYLISSLMEEAIASSQLEGAATTREVAKAMLRARRKPANPSERMIVNNYLTIKEIIKLKASVLTPDLIRSIHGTISRGTLEKPEYEGSYRKSNEVKVVDQDGEIFYDPPHHDRLPELMDRLCKFANGRSDEEFIHPIIRGIILHFLVGYIHPFVDGNGRTARAIFYWYLISRGYWLVEFLSISRIIVRSPGQYARAYLYTEYDENDLTYFIDFNLKSMEIALNDLKKYIRVKIRKKRDLQRILKHEDVNERQAEIINQFLDDPDRLLAINEIQNRFGTSYQTARTDLMHLEKIGYLESKLSGKKLLFFKSSKFEAKIRKIEQHNN